MSIPEVRFVAKNRHYYLIVSNYINANSNDKNERYFAAGSARLSQNQINKLIDDEWWRVKERITLNKNITFSEIQITRLINDQELMVRRRIVHRKELTESHVNTLIFDPGVRYLAIQKCKLSNKQIELLLNDSDEYVKSLIQARIAKES